MGANGEVVRARSPDADLVSSLAQTGGLPVLMVAGFACLPGSLVGQDVPGWRVAVVDTVPASRDLPTAALVDARWDGSGRILALGRERDVVYVLDVDGGRAEVIGGVGDGPGEFRDVSYLGRSDDGLWVIDSRKRSLAVFDENRELLRERRLEVGYSSGSLPLEPVWRWADGGVVATERIAGGNVARVSEQGTRVVELGETVGSGRVLTTLAVEHAFLVAAAGGRVFQGLQPWSDADRVAFGPAGHTIAVLRRPSDLVDGSATYEISFWKAERRTPRSVRVRFRPRPLDAEEVEGYLQDLASGLGEGADDLAEAIRDSLFVPEGVPIARGGRILGGPGQFFVGWSGEAWLRAEEDESDDAEDTDSVWHIVDEDGFVARATVPEGIRLSAVRGEHALGLIRNAFDVTNIVRLRIERAP